MKDSCVIKSSKNGLVCVLDNEIEFEELLKDVAKKFSENREFFGEGIMTLGIDGRLLSSEESVQLLETIESNSDLKFRFIEDVSGIKDIRMQNMVDKFYTDKPLENAKIHFGSVIKDSVITSDSSLLILGDVKSKATVRAKGNIIVMGSLEGTAEAGIESDGDTFYIITNTLNTNNISLGSYSGNIHKNNSFFSRFKKNTVDPVIVGVFDGHIIAEPLSSGYLNQIREKIQEAED